MVRQDDQKIVPKYARADGKALNGIRRHFTVPQTGSLTEVPQWSHSYSTRRVCRCWLGKGWIIEMEADKVNRTDVLEH